MQSEAEGIVKFISAPQGKIVEILIRCSNGNEVHVDGTNLPHDPDELIDKTVRVKGTEKSTDGNRILIPEMYAPQGNDPTFAFQILN